MGWSRKHLVPSICHETPKQLIEKTIVKLEPWDRVCVFLASPQDGPVPSPGVLQHTQVNHDSSMAVAITENSRRGCYILHIHSVDCISAPMPLSSPSLFSHHASSPPAPPLINRTPHSACRELCWLCRSLCLILCTVCKALPRYWTKLGEAACRHSHLLPVLLRGLQDWVPRQNSLPSFIPSILAHT